MNEIFTPDRQVFSSRNESPLHASSFWKETRSTLFLAMPIILGQVLQNSLGVIDTLMVGRVSVAAVAACSFATALFTVPLVFGFGVLAALSVFVARAAAQHNLVETAHLLRRGLVLSMGLAIAMVLGITFVSRGLVFFHEPAAVIAQGRPFLLLLTYSIVPMYLFQTLKQFCEAQHAAWPSLLILIIGVLVNVALNWIFIFGHWGAPPMGLLGAGWATLLTRTLIFGVLAGFVTARFFQTSIMRNAFGDSVFKFHGYRELLNLGLPVGAQVILEVGAFTMAAVMMGWISEAALAAHQVAISIASMSFMVPLGLSMALAIRVSHALGRGAWGRAAQAIRGTLLVTVSFMSGTALILFAFSHQLAAFFILDASVVMLAAHILIIAGLFQIFDGIQVVSIGALRGLHDVKVPTLINFFGYWGLALPLSYFLAFNEKWGALGVWSGLLAGLAFVACFLIIRLELALRKHAHTPLT